MKIFSILIIFFMIFALGLGVINVSAEFDGNCPKEGMILEIFPPDYRIDFNTVTFDEQTTFCVKAGNKNSGKIVGTSFTVDWRNNGGQIPEISHVSVYENPTAVMLLYFNAEFYKKYVTLNWETANEIDIIGFNVYRSKGVNGLKRKLNNNLIQSNCVGELTGSVYELTDFHKRKYDKHFYWLEVVDIYGNSELYEAYKVKS